MSCSTDAPENLFDRSREYDEMLHQGVRLSGEDKHYFIEGRVRSLRERLEPDFQPRHILDFGCGLGDTCAHFARIFPDARVTGVDTAPSALEHARSRFGSDRVHFESLDAFDAADHFDLCYTNGVFHHIPPPERVGAVERVRKALRPGGRFALMENNPWNPGTRMVMSRIEFDRDAIPISPPEARRLLRSGGFERCAPGHFMFYFPRPLAFLRFAESWLTRLPLGAQYFILATKT